MYDEISELYHLVYPDWPGAIEQQASALNLVIEKELNGGVVSILDVSCGIGTQALGLSALGHKVVGSDLSAGAVARAKREATATEPAKVVSGHSQYFAIAADRLIEILLSCGFGQVERRDDVSHNLVLVGRKPR